MFHISSHDISVTCQILCSFGVIFDHTGAVSLYLTSPFTRSSALSCSSCSAWASAADGRWSDSFNIVVTGGDPLKHLKSTF